MVSKSHERGFKVRLNNTEEVDELTEILDSIVSDDGYDTVLEEALIKALVKGNIEEFEGLLTVDSIPYNDIAEVALSWAKYAREVQKFNPKITDEMISRMKARFRQVSADHQEKLKYTNPALRKLSRITQNFKRCLKIATVC